MEGAEEIGKDAHDSALLHNNENGPIVANTKLEKEGSPPLPEDTIQLEIKESSHSSEDSPRLELPLYEDNPNSVHVPTLYPEDHVQPAASGLHSPIDDQSLVEAGAHVSEIEGDACIAPSTTVDLHDNSGNTDGATLDGKNHTFHTLPGEKSLEGNELVENGNEMNIGDTPLESPTDSEIKEGELTNGLATEQTLLDCVLKEEEMNGVDRMKLLPENETKEDESNDMGTEMEQETGNEVKDELLRKELDIKHEVEVKTPQKSFLLETDAVEGDDSGTEMEQVSFMKELETFHKERCLEFKPPKFYGEPLNCLKLWRAVVRFGGYEQVTSCKLWRQVGESFKPPKTCTTVSWTFRCFYEKALLEYEKYKMRNGELPFTDVSFTAPATAGNQASVNQASGSGRARRDAAARAMQGWHSQRLLSNGEVGDPIIKDKSSSSLPKREKQLKNIGLLKRKKPSPVDRADKVAHIKASKSHLDTMAVDIGPPADWVKVNVQRTKDCFEVYALVPGLLREEVHVQSDPAGRLVISGQPEQLDNPWGVAAFKKVVSLPSRIDPHQTSAVVTLHGQLFVRVPFEPSDL